jgi:CheY-like chemotaxis protein
MTLSSQPRTKTLDNDDAVADVLLVSVPAESIGIACGDLLSHVRSAREALAMLKLSRYRLLLASLEVPDMRPWDLFHRARRTQSRLQCVLLDPRLSLDDEQRVRQAGAGAFASFDADLVAMLMHSSERRTNTRPPGRPGISSAAASLNEPSRAPP